MVAIYLTNPDHLGNILDSKPERLGNFSEWKCVEELHVWTTVSTINHFVEAGPSRKRYWERDARAAACAVEDDAIVSMRVADLCRGGVRCHRIRVSRHLCSIFFFFSERTRVSTLHGAKERFVLHSFLAN